MIVNYYEHHLGDYMRDTAHLSILEDGAYRRLLDAYYIKEAPIPLDQREACRLVRAQSRPERDAVQVVLKEFFQQTPEGWRHRRCEQEIARFQDKQAKARNSANARWGAKQSHREGNANAHANAPPDAMRTHSEGNAPRARPQTPDTRHQTPDTSGRAGKPAADKAKAELWKAAVSILSSQGMPEPQARSLFGKLSKDYPEGDIVLQAVQGAISEQPADARAYLIATCKTLAGQRIKPPPPTSFAERDRIASMQRWEEMTGREHPDLEPLRRQGSIPHRIVAEARPLETLTYEPAHQSH